MLKKKKKKIEIHKHTHTNKPKHTNNKETDLYLSEQSVFDRCLTGTIGAHESCLIEASGSHLIGARGYGSCLIRVRQIGACGSELWIGAAVDWSCGSKLWIGAYDWSCGLELCIGASDRSCGSVLLTGACDREGERWVDRCF